MADTPHRPAQPLSPFLTIFHWPVTMATSIVHRATGVGLAGGIIALGWWLFAIANGPDSYALFYRLASSVVGQVLLYGFTWALCFHFLNGIRHLMWDLGFGYKRATADRTGVLVIILSLILVAAIYGLINFGYAGYYQ
jgi:succinate dehydrogenase / fumarate reductase, cytochrome b subunit